MADRVWVLQKIWHSIAVSVACSLRPFMVESDRSVFVRDVVVSNCHYPLAYRHMVSEVGVYVGRI